jgi:prevent-host-death family protein
MIAVNVHEAKTHLSKLLSQVIAGEEVTISRYGRPTARLVPCSTEQKMRHGGADKGTFRVPRVAFAPLETYPPLVIHANAVLSGSLPSYFRVL